MIVRYTEIFSICQGEPFKKTTVVPKADPGISCPIPLPEKDRPVLMAAVIARADRLVFEVKKIDEPSLRERYGRSETVP